MSIEKRIARLEGLGDSDTIKNFESFMLECTKVMDALAKGVKLDSIKPKRFNPTMREGLARAIRDIDEMVQDALKAGQEPLGLEIASELILIYLDKEMRDLLTPTLLELVETILQLERAGKLAVGAEG